MRVEFVSRAKALELILKGHFETPGVDFVSVSDTHKESKSIRSKWRANKVDENAAVFLKFLDIEDSVSGFNEIKAEQAAAFIKKSQLKGHDLVVHCWAGVSRSGALAMFAKDYYGYENPLLDGYKLYNKWVYAGLVEASGVMTLRKYYQNLSD